jgi:hypothetical protein
MSGGVTVAVCSASRGLAVAQTLEVAIIKYCAVVLRLRCPSSSWIVRRSVPASSRWTAKAWRSECLLANVVWLLAVLRAV